MDLRSYYETIRQIETDIQGDPTVVVSTAGLDCGRAGVLMDVPRNLAARLIAEQKAELASPDAAIRFRAEVESAWKTAAHGLPRTKER